MFQKTNDKNLVAENKIVGHNETFFKPLIQPKLTINQPDDEYEREADAMAEHVMRMTDDKRTEQSFFQPSVSSIQKKCAACEEEEKQGLQRKNENGLIQRQDTSTTETSTTQTSTTDIPHLTLESSSLFQSSSGPDFLAMRQPFFNRNIGHLWDPDSALHVWQYNFDFFRRIGLSPDLSTTLTNFTAPRFIDSQLKASNPTWWEITDRELNTSTIGGSIPVLEFDPNFALKAPSWLKSIFGGGGNQVQRKENKIQRKENNENNIASPSVENYINSMEGKGTSLSKKEKDFFEPKFGYDFSDVKIHHDNEAAASAQSVNALAYTHGKNIVFDLNQYKPETNEGKKLLAHELTHVVQQNVAGENIQRANPPGWDELHKYKDPGGATVRVTHFVVKDAASDPFNDYAAKAKSMLQEHGLNLDVYEAGTLDFPRPLQDLDDVKELRMAAHKKFQDKQNDDKARLPVISAVYSEIKGYETHNLNGQTISGTEWLPFVLLNAGNKSADKVTLLHEIGHAANVPGLKDVEVKPTDAVQNFMLYGDNRTDMLKQQVIAIAKAYFSG